MKIKDLKKWFKTIPEELDDIDLEIVDIDCTRDETLLNLIVTSRSVARIKTLFIKEKIIDYREKNDEKTKTKD